MQVPLATPAACAVLVTLTLAAAAQVAPATLSVEVASSRDGGRARRIVAKVRPGEAVLLRDEASVSYVSGVDRGSASRASATGGVVATVVPRVREGRFSLDVTVVVRDVALDGAEVPLPGGGRMVVSVPSVSERSVEETASPEWSDGAWRYRRALGDGRALDVRAAPLVPFPTGATGAR